VIGLGNPGAAYAATRHNIGFRVIDRLADILDVRESFVHGNCSISDTSRHDWSVLLCKPMTFMNRSGDAVIEIQHRYGIACHELLVVYDDVHLPLGTLRLRRGGSSGGHNGLSSIIQATEGCSVARLRCGVDFSSTGADLVDYVLSPFEKVEIPLVDTMVERAADAVLALMELGWDRAMNVYNTQTNNQDLL